MTPTAAQVRQLPAVVTATVDDAWIDGNGHMNVVHYLAMNEAGTTALCEDLVGIDDTYRTRRGMGIFVAEHHLKYFSELRAGERLSVHVRVLERSERTVHMMGLLVDDTHDRLSNTLELTAVHVDLASRTAVPMPADIASAFDRFIAESNALDWQAPACGGIGVRRR